MLSNVLEVGLFTPMRKKLKTWSGQIAGCFELGEGIAVDQAAFFWKKGGERKQLEGLKVFQCYVDVMDYITTYLQL